MLLAYALLMNGHLYRKQEALVTAHRAYNLDALRGVAVCAVLFQHVIGDIARTIPGRDASILKALAIDHFDLGRFGVTLFFLISGYLISMSFKGRAPLRTFLISRLCRLYPVFWLSVLTMAMALHFAGHPANMRRILANLTMIYPLFHQTAITGVYWTMEVELLFYGVAACLFIVDALDRPWIVAGVAAVAIATSVLPIIQRLVGHSVLPSFNGYHLAYLLLGCLLRQALKGDRQAMIASSCVIGGLAVTLPLVSGLIVDTGVPYSIGHATGAVLAVALSIVVFVASFCPRFAIPSSIWLRLGSLSYPIYLLHEPLSTVGAGLMQGNAPWAAARYAAFVICGTLFVADAVHAFIEKPAIAAGRQLFKNSLKNMA